MDSRKVPARCWTPSDTPAELVFIRSWGNRGDDLIYAGTRRLLRDLPYREYDIRQLDRVPAGATAILSGGGAWCRPYHLIAEMLPQVEARVSRLIVFPLQLRYR